MRIIPFSPTGPAPPSALTSHRPARDLATRGYQVVLLAPVGFVHSMGLDEIGRLLHLSLESLGHRSCYQVNTLSAHATNIILGANFIEDASLLSPGTYIVYQLEQLSDREGWFSPVFLKILKGAREVWDYSRENIEFLAHRGVSARLLPIGYHEGLESIPKVEQDIDVLFYGGLNDRRLAVLKDLQNDCKLATLYAVFGQRRDEFVARSKIVLNMHFYQAQIMEQARISYLLNNRCFVITEDAPHNPYSGHIISVPYERLAETCRHYLAHPEERRRLAEEGHRFFSSMPMTELLRNVLPV